MTTRRADRLSLLRLLQKYFPDIGSELGEPGAALTGDIKALRDDLDALLRRLRAQTRVIIGVVVACFVLELGVALLTNAQAAVTVAVGATGGGALCFNGLLAVAKRMFWVDALITALKHDPRQLNTLVTLAREQLGVPGLPPAPTPLTPPPSGSGATPPPDGAGAVAAGAVAVAQDSGAGVPAPGAGLARVITASYKCQLT